MGGPKFRLPLDKIAGLNAALRRHHCPKTQQSLSDQALRTLYRQQPSVKRRENILRYVLAQQDIQADRVSSIVEDLTDTILVPAGTKAAVRGHVFNRMVAQYLASMPICYRRGIVWATEQPCPIFPTGEIPDWYIWDIGQNRAIVGMNQVDLWAGGAQINRADKYINAATPDNILVLAVVANYYQLKTGSNRIAYLLNKAFGSQIVYLPQLESVVVNFFDGYDAITWRQPSANV